MPAAQKGHPDLGSIAELIPVWQPAPPLLELVAALRPFLFAAILVVDDGSAPAAQPIFQALRDDGVPVCHHAINLGRGRALKTGFDALPGYPAVHGVVTAGADGQHTPNVVEVERVPERVGISAQHRHQHRGCGPGGASCRRRFA